MSGKAGTTMRKGSPVTLRFGNFLLLAKSHSRPRDRIDQGTSKTPGYATARLSEAWC
jgi:hypothetical protein